MNQMDLAIVTAGGAGMFCGTCMHDNTWARALGQAGISAALIPLYTPIRVDEEDQTSSSIFYGGINTYLNDRYSFWRKLPRFFTRWLDSPKVLDLATRWAVGNDAAFLGSMTVSMLQGEAGPHRQAGAELADFVTHLSPKLVCFSNSLLTGSLRVLREKYRGPVYCVLQGEDVFLDGLIEPYRSQVMTLLRQKAAEFDGYIVHSDFYRDYMAQYLNLPHEKFIELPLTIDCSKHEGQPKPDLGSPPTVGYFARICPEKGFDLVVDSVIELKRDIPDVKLRAGGYLGSQNQAYFENVKRRAAVLGESFEYIGSPATHAEKVQFLKSLDVFCVPARFQEPKGIYVLEAWANGIPSVLPHHAAFPSLVRSTGGGLLANSFNPTDIADSLRQILLNTPLRTQLGTAAHVGVRLNHDLTSIAQATISRLLQPTSTEVSGLSGPQNRDSL